MNAIRHPARALSLAVAMALAVPAIGLAAGDDKQRDQQQYRSAQQDQYRDQQAIGMRWPAERPGQNVADARREAVIWTTFATNDSLREAGIDVEVRDNTAILTGVVESRVERELAEELATNVRGINRVDNRLSIDPDVRTRMAADTRTLRSQDRDAIDRRTDRDFGTAVRDATTTAQVKSKLLWNTRTSGMEIDVDTYRGRVTLSGTVDNPAEKQLAERLAMDTQNVLAVNNQLRVDEREGVAMRADTGRTTTDARERDFERGTAATDDRRRLAEETRDRDLRHDERDERITTRVEDRDMQRGERVRDEDVAARGESEQPVNDAWITTKVKSTLLFSRNVDGTNIDVDTKNGVVSLTGKVDSQTARRMAIELARDIRGVRNVDASGLDIAEDRAVVAAEDEQ